LSYPWQHGIDLFPQTLQRRLLQDVRGPLDAFGNLLGEAFRLSDQ
jgi:hypothetical protein